MSAVTANSLTTRAARLSDRAARYIARMPAAVSGEGGHRATFAVAVALIHGFALSEADAWPILCAYNARCQPPWTDRELRHKLACAARLTRHPKARGYLREDRAWRDDLRVVRVFATPQGTPSPKTIAPFQFIDLNQLSIAPEAASLEKIGETRPRRRS